MVCVRLTSQGKNLTHSVSAVRRAATTIFRLAQQLCCSMYQSYLETLWLFLRRRSQMIDPFHVRIFVGTIDMLYHPQTIPQNITIKYYDILEQLQLVLEHLGHS